jgi:predicted RNase H-like nuclease
MIALGLDGFRCGWVAVRIAGRLRTLHFLESIGGIAALGYDRACIDIPIGMTDDGVRRCDLLAREKLRPHASRVFTGARRWLWQDYRDPDKANREARRRGQHAASRQLWHLGAKIMEADAFVRAHPRRGLHEAHPELVFLRLNANVPLASKKSGEGIARRRLLLRRDGFADLDRWLAKDRIGTGAKIDDVLDACACAIAARDVHLGHGLPATRPPRDAFGLAMQIRY